MSSGVIYYNVGRQYLVQLLVSLYSLRKYCNKEVVILNWGNVPEACKRIAQATGAQIKEIHPEIVKCRYPIFMAKTQLYQYSPFGNTLYLDSDTLVVKPIDELFPLIKQHSFVATRDGRALTGKLQRRFNPWKPFAPDLVTKAKQSNFLINCGVMGFSKKSELLAKWYPMAMLAKDTLLPDEVSCQLLLQKYPHFIADSSFNCLAKYGINNSAKIIHYHSNKYLKEGTRWLQAYLEVASKNIANVKSWSSIYDYRLRRYLKNAHSYNV